MPTTACPKLANGEVVRITKVDHCGRPVAGAGNAIVSECWVEVQMSPNIDTADDINLKAMNGRNCGYRKGRQDLLSLDLTATFYEANPETLSLLTGNPVYFDQAGNPIGWDDCQIDVENGFSLELWQSVIVDGCPDDIDDQYFYWVLPWITGGVLGDVTVNDGGLTFTLTASTRANNAWHLGPWDVQAQDNNNTPGPLLTPIGTDCHRRGFLTTIEPPEASCQSVLVPPNNVS